MSEDQKKQIICPKCGSSDVAKYIYGNVMLDDKIEKEIREKKIILGGCDVTIEVDSHTGQKTYPPEYRCNKCKTKWGGRHA